MNARTLLETCANKGELIIHICNIDNEDVETVMTADEIRDNDILDWKVVQWECKINVNAGYQTHIYIWF